VSAVLSQAKPYDDLVSRLVDTSKGDKPFTTWPSLSNRRSGPAIGVASSGCLAWAAGYVPSFRGGLLDMCEFAHPEIRNPDPTGNYEIHPAPSQSDLQRQLRKQSH
jgi:hypothetical protein